MAWFYQEPPKRKGADHDRAQIPHDPGYAAARAGRTDPAKLCGCREGAGEILSTPTGPVERSEIRGFFLHLINDKAAARSTVTVYLCGIKFFYETTLGRKLPILEIVRPAKRQKLPVVLAAGQVKELLDQITNPVHRMCLTLIYACGLRLSEGIHLRVEDIDSERMLVAVRNGKGGKDRYVPLPQHTLEQLRAYWSLHRPKIWLFSAQKGGPPLNPTSIQDLQGGSTAKRHRQKRFGPHPQAFVCHLSSRKRGESAHHPATSRPQESQHHSNLHPPHAEKRRPACHRHQSALD
jgi:integrase